MGCEMSPKLEQQQTLMSQSPSETTQTAKNPDSAKRKREGEINKYKKKKKKRGRTTSLVLSEVPERPFLSA